MHNMDTCAVQHRAVTLLSGIAVLSGPHRWAITLCRLALHAWSAHGCALLKSRIGELQDYLHFVDNFSGYVLCDAANFGGRNLWPNSDLKLLWQYWKAVVRHHFRFSSESFLKAERDQALNNLLHFARIGQEQFGAPFCTYNLHMLVCRCGHLLC